MNIDEILEDVIKSDSTIKRYDSPKRGRKLCPDCEFYVGLRTKVCECGHKFTKADKKIDPQKKDKIVEKPSTEDKLYSLSVNPYGGRIVYSGSGPIPYKPISTDYDGIADMCDNIVYDGQNEGKIYTVSAIKLWIQGLYGYKTEKYNSVCEHIDKWYYNKVNNIKEICNED